MPRELIHWHVLEETTTALEESGETPAVVECLRKHRAAAYLGAVAPDAPYYTNCGLSREMTDFAETLHGNYGEDTFDVIKKYAYATLEQDNDRSLFHAFILGYVTHCATDIAFHPMVFYFTGNYYHPEHRELLRAKARHRLLETLLDEWLAPQVSLWNQRSIKKLLIELEGDRERLMNFLKQNLTTGAAVNWNCCYKHMAFLQACFLNDACGAFVRFLTLFLGTKLALSDALFSFRRRAAQPRFEQDFSFENPVSKEADQATVRELLSRAIEHSSEVFRKFDAIASGQTKDVDEALGIIRGLSLNTGLYQTKESDLQHFSATGIDLPGLRIR